MAITKHAKSAPTKDADQAGSTTTISDRASAASDSAKDLLAQAQTKVSDAITSALGAAMENPKTAAAIATGAAATIAGAAFGISKLRVGDASSKSEGGSGKIKADAKKK